MSTEMLTKNERPTLQAHWDKAYADGGAAGVSWYEPTARVSLEIVSALNVSLDAGLIDVGGGTSMLAAELIAKGYTDVSVLDLSEIALREAHDRTGSAVAWLHADVRGWKPERRYALWHDCAVLHFFTDERDRQGYLRALHSAVAPGGFVVLGVFARNGAGAMLRAPGGAIRRRGPRAAPGRQIPAMHRALRRPPDAHGREATVYVGRVRTRSLVDSLLSPVGQPQPPRDKPERHEAKVSDAWPEGAAQERTTARSF